MALTGNTGRIRADVGTASAVVPRGGRLNVGVSLGVIDTSLLSPLWTPRNQMPKKETTSVEVACVCSAGEKVAA